MNKILAFIFFCISFVLISGSETLQVDKEIYKELLSEISLTLDLLDCIVPLGRKSISFREARDLTMALKNYEIALKSDNVIYKFCGSIERVEGQHPRYRMLNIFKRDTRNPFAEIKGKPQAMIKRMIKGSELKLLPKGTEKQIRDKWSDYMDRDLVHFAFDNKCRTADLDEVITNRNIEKVKELLNEKFIEQDGVLVLNLGIVNFSLEIRSRGNIYNIDRFNYKSAFIGLNKIKFIRK